MGEKTDKAKGTIKERVGEMTDNEQLEREGKIDRASGAVKGAGDTAKEKLDDGVDALKRTARDVTDGR